MTTRVVVNSKPVTSKKNGGKKATNANGKHSSEKAGSVHDLRRFAVSSLLKVPPQYTTFNEPQRQPFRLQDHQQQLPASVRGSEDLNNQSSNEEDPKFVLVNTFKVAEFFKAAKCWTLQKNPARYHDNENNSFEDDDHDYEDFPLEEMQATDSRQKRASL